MADADSRNLDKVRAAARAAELRMRLARTLAALPTAATVAVTCSGVALAARKVAPIYVKEQHAWVVIVAAAAGVLAMVLVQLLRRLPPHAGALALDRHHELNGRLANALEFDGVSGDTRSPFMAIAIDDACDAAAKAAGGKGLDPRRAVRVPFPAELGVTALVAAAVFGLSLLEVRTLRDVEQPKQVERIHALEMSDDDLDLFRDAADEIGQDQNPEMKQAIDEFNQLIEDIAQRRITREEAFRRMRKIEDKLTENASEDKKAMQDALQQMAKELDKSAMSKPAASALKNNQLAEAGKELKKLAKALKEKGKNKPSAAELQRLKEALNRASKANKKVQESLAEKRAELQKQLLKQKKKVEEAKTKEEREKQKSLLRKKERELKRLQRQQQAAGKAGRQLSKLDRQLAKAAADLARDLGMSAEDLEQLAEDMNRLEQDQLTDKEKEKLRKRLQQLRELIRQQGQGGKKLQKRLQRFMKRARGGSSAGGKSGRGGKGGRQGEGQEGEMRPGGEKGGKNGEGQGEGEGEGMGEGMTIGPGGKPIPVEGPGGAGDGDGGGDQPGGDGKGQGGKSWGTGSADPLGDKTDIKGGTHDVRAEGLDNKKGPTNAQVIVSAARRGFTGKPYKKVYKKYRTVAEDQIDREKIPDGMRFYVRRYFQLIRPRE